MEQARPPMEPHKWLVALETPAKGPADDPNAAMTMQSAESLLAIEPPEFVAPMGLTLDMERVKLVISKHLRNRMRLADRYNRLLLSGPHRDKAKLDKADLRVKAQATDPPAIQVILDLQRRLEESDSIEDERTRAATQVQLYKMLTNMVTAFENGNTKIFTEMWELVEMHQRQTEHKDKVTNTGLGDMSTAKLRELRDATIRS